MGYDYEPPVPSCRAYGGGVRQARQDGRGWIDRGPQTPAHQLNTRGERGPRKVDVLGSKRIIDRFSVRHGAPDGGMNHVMSRSLPRRKLRSYTDLLIASDIANPLREARIKERAKELITVGFTGLRARQRARREVALR